jgi:hypothetical protein
MERKLAVLYNTERKIFNRSKRTLVYINWAKAMILVLLNSRWEIAHKMCRGSIHLKMDWFTINYNLLSITALDSDKMFWWCRHRFNRLGRRTTVIKVHRETRINKIIIITCLTVVKVASMEDPADHNSAQEVRSNQVDSIIKMMITNILM